MSELTINKPPQHRAVFSDGYKLSVFQTWYKLGKCPANKLFDHIENDPVSGDRPTLNTLQTWVSHEFVEKAEVLDMQVEMEMQGRLIQEKVAMLERHTETAMQMQEMATTYLDAHKDELKVPNAVRLLVEGIRIEVESRGIPQVLKKMVNKSDEELMKELQDIVSKSPVTFEPTDEE